MITVERAEQIINAQARDYGTESIPFESALGRALAEDIKADRDLPPFDRITMDGIAISFNAFENGIRKFKIIGAQAAGDAPIDINSLDECIEIMTGAALPETVDTVIRYEDIDIQANIATVLVNNISKGQSLHFKGADKKQGEVVAAAGQLVTPAVISLAASVGKTELLVKKIPRVVIISSGDELVNVDETPSPYQIRKSNSYTLRSILRKYTLDTDIQHITDVPEIIHQKLDECLQNYDVIILTGGISMGKFDHIPNALKDLKVETLFHKVQQRPGKPFWFGKHDNGVLVFAFPGNPVAAFMCTHRYFLPWLNKSMGLSEQNVAYALLNKDFIFDPQLQYFLQVKLRIDTQAQLIAEPIAGNGSGDFANLADTDAFMELPLENSNFKKGEVYRVWLFV